MATSSTKTRFDAKLPEEQKELFERAALVGGYRSLTNFIISAAQAKATEIITAHETLMASERDQRVFFDALLNPPAPTEKLRAAAKRYKTTLTR